MTMKQQIQQTIEEFSKDYMDWLDGMTSGEGITKFKNKFKDLVNGLGPRESLTPDRWADKYRFITKGPVPGKWSYDETPYMREPLQSFVLDEVETLVLMFSTQVGKTAFLETIMGYIIHQTPCPFIFVLPNTEFIAAFKKDKLEDMFESSPVFYKDGLVKRPQPGKSENNKSTIRFNNGVGYFVSAQSMSSLAGKSTPIVSIDELDVIPYNKNEGDVSGIVRRRGDSYGDRFKMLLTSTPRGDAVYSRINKEFLQGDQRKYLVPCPHCRHEQFFIFPQLRWETRKLEDGGSQVVEGSTHYLCAGNNCKIHDRDKPKMLRLGKWIATAEAKNRKTRSYTINALYSPFFGFEKVATEFLKAKATPGGLLTFFNTVMAEPYNDPTEQPKEEVLYARAEDWDRARIPRGVGFLTCGVDVQEKGDGRLEASVWGWGRNNHRWLIDNIVIPGNYKDPETWKHLDEVRHHKYMTADGRELEILLTFVDSGAGNTTPYVYEYARLNRFDKVMAVKGSSKDSSELLKYTPIGKLPNGKKMDNAIRLVGINTNQFKKWFYHAIDEVDDPKLPYYVHTPQYVGRNVHKQLCAEKVFVNGNITTFVAVGPNEALDCAVYSAAAAKYLNIDLTDWDKLFEKQGATEEKEEALLNLEKEVLPLAIHEICILQRVQVGKKWYLPGAIIEVNEQESARLCAGDNPFAHKTSERPPLKHEIEAQIKANTPTKPQQKKKSFSKGWL